MMSVCFNSKLTDTDLLRIAYTADPSPKPDMDKLVNMLRSVANEAALQAYLDAQKTESSFEDSNFFDYFILILSGLGILGLIIFFVFLNN
jgi:hypothetical protein